MTETVNVEKALKKFDEARRLLLGCCGTKGIFAGSGLRYKNQYWTRDLVLALGPALEILANSPRFPIEQAEKFRYLVRHHLLQLAHRQGTNGAIPILFSDFCELFCMKLEKAGVVKSQIDSSQSFVLKRILEGMDRSGNFPEFDDFPQSDLERGLYRLTPGTTDSELLFALAVYSWDLAGDKRLKDAADKAVRYIEEHYMHDGLHHGADWRDTMEKFFRDRPLLTNNALLSRVYLHQHAFDKKHALQDKIREKLGKGGVWLDYPDATRFDPLGASLAVLNDIVTIDQYKKVMEGFNSVDTDYGVTIQCKHNAYRGGEKEVIDATDGIVVWPFVVGFTVLAALKMDYLTFAEAQFNKLINHQGFAEWYDPRDGRAWGEPEQGWSAALYVRAFDALRERTLFVPGWE